VLFRSLVGCAHQLAYAHGDTPNPLVGGIYKTKDDRCVFLVQMNPKNWEPMCDGLGAPALKIDKRFSEPGLRLENHTDLVKELDAIFSKLTLAEASEKLHAAKTNFSVVKTNEELPNDQQMIDNGLFPEIAGTNGILTVQSPVSVDGQEKATPQAAPEQIGQDTVDELKKVGFSDADIARLAASGAIGIVK
jgi:formyl-CoA transferase